MSNSRRVSPIPTIYNTSSSPPPAAQYSTPEYTDYYVDDDAAPATTSENVKLVALTPKILHSNKRNSTSGSSPSGSSILSSRSNLDRDRHSIAPSFGPEVVVDSSSVLSVDRSPGVVKGSFSKLNVAVGGHDAIEPHPQPFLHPHHSQGDRGGPRGSMIHQQYEMHPPASPGVSKGDHPSSRRESRVIGGQSASNFGEKLHSMGIGVTY